MMAARAGDPPQRTFPDVPGPPVVGERAGVVERGEDWRIRPDLVQRLEDALNTGRLSTTPTDATYAGRYMYMGTVNGRDLFKHIDSRQYNV